MENDLWTALNKFWSTIQLLRRGNQSTIKTVYSWDGVLVTLTQNVLRSSRWLKASLWQGPRGR